LRKANFANIRPNVYFVLGGKYGDLNQDRHLVYTLNNPDVSHPQKVARIAGVFDGHSMLGELAAQTASEAFQEFFEKVILMLYLQF
jgi:serine/threonine protein phosphatase PrpC